MGATAFQHDINPRPIQRVRVVGGLHLDGFVAADERVFIGVYRLAGVSVDGIVP